MVTGTQSLVFVVGRMLDFDEDVFGDAVAYFFSVLPLQGTTRPLNISSMGDYCAAVASGLILETYCVLDDQQDMQDHGVGHLIFVYDLTC